MVNEDPEYFFQVFRFTPAEMENLLELVGPSLAKQHVLREPISPKQRLLMTLEYLASGNTQKSVAQNYRVGRSTICGIISATCQVITTVLQPKFLPIPTTQDWLHIAKGFQQQWNFPNCVGAIDGKHFAIPKPPGSGSLYFNYKGFFSIVMLASCDACYKFTTINVGAVGSESDGGIFRRCRLGQKLLSSTLNMPPPAGEEVLTVTLPHVFVADEAFPLLPNVMRPYPGEHLTIEQRVYNYRLSRARRIIENAFGILVVRWRLLLDTMHMHPTNAQHAITACVLLHNYIMSQKPLSQWYVPSAFMDSEDPATGNIQVGQWRGLLETAETQRKPRSTCTSRAAVAIRDTFKHYFNTVGAVPWQRERLDDF